MMQGQDCTKNCYLWKKIFEDVERLAYLVYNSYFIINRLVAITRGGLIITGLLSQYLKICDIETVCLSSYDNHNKGKICVIKNNIKDYNNTLFVDDLVDSGDTLNYLQNKSPDKKILTAVLYVKSISEEIPYKPTFFIEKVPKNEWLVFPWEVVL